MKHTCHLPPCKKVCPPRHLFCREHWAMVPTELQQAVYNGLETRGQYVDGTWVAWWRAQAAATVHVMRSLYHSEADVSRIDKMEQRDAEFVERLLGKGEP